MALIKCPECGRERVSDSAESCPECGFGIKNYVDAERKKVAEEAAAKEKSEKELALKAEKVNRLKEEFKVEVEKIKSSQPPEKGKVKVNFENNFSVVGGVLLVISLLILFVALLDSNMKALFGFISLVSIGGFLLYYPAKKEEGSKYRKTVENWDKTKNEKIELLKQEYAKKADNVIKYGNENGEKENNNNQQIINEYIVRCPICGSSQIKRLTVVDRGSSFLFWGFASAKVGKQFECQNCEYRW